MILPKPELPKKAACCTSHLQPAEHAPVITKGLQGKSEGLQDDLQDRKHEKYDFMLILSSKLPVTICQKLQMLKITIRDAVIFYSSEYCLGQPAGNMLNLLNYALFTKDTIYTSSVKVRSDWSTVNFSVC